MQKDSPTLAASFPGKPILIAGASGHLGKSVARELKGRGVRVRAMVRRSLAPEALGADEVVVADALDPPSLAAAVDGVGAVFSCLGASVQPSLRHGRASYGDVDTPANCNLIAAASRGSVTRFA